MIKLNRSNEHRWTIDKNVNDKTLLADFAALMAQKRAFRLNELVDDSITQGRVNDPSVTYGSYNQKGSQITTGVRLLQAKYYMLGYDVNDRATGAKKFMPSPMLINYIESNDDVSQANNFLVNLFSIQYPNPANRTPDCFEIYAGRLFVKLLLDSRISRKLYIDECVWFLPFLEKINENVYEELIESILEFRNLSFEEKQKLFLQIDDYEYLFANVMHEMNYYFLRLFQSMGVFDIIEDRDHNGGNLMRFKHSVSRDPLTNHIVSLTYRNDAYASRKKYSGYVTLSENVLEAAEKLNSSFSAFEIPTKQTDEDIYNLQDWYTMIYEVQPLNYLNCINTRVDRKAEVQAIVTEMVRASKFGSHDGKEFENALKPFMELFRETLDVQIIAGAGNTDLLCTMESMPSGYTYKMNVDAKTRGTALSELNASRLMRHLRRHGAEFCMVVAPRFASGVREDIQYSKVVVVKSEVLANYCYYECTQSGNDFADFSAIRSIIDNKLGCDITQDIENLTVTRYAV